MRETQATRLGEERERETRAFVAGTLVGSVGRRENNSEFVEKRQRAIDEAC